MHHSYKTVGTCSSQIDFDLDNGKIKNVSFIGGCNGNLKSITKLIDGENAQVVMNKLKGIECGLKKTSCGDQLAKAIEVALKEEKEL